MSLAAEWPFTLAATYASATSFTVSGDITSAGSGEASLGRRVWVDQTAARYGTVSAASYAAGATTVTLQDITDGSGAAASLANAAMTANFGISNPVNTSVPWPFRDVRSQSIAADGNDQTAALTTLFGGLNAAERALYLTPPGTRFVTEDVIASLPPGVVVLDLSSINSFNSAGETTKEYGLLSRDKSVSDTNFVMASGHHPVIQLNNYGNAEDSPGTPTTSALERKASLLWAAGKFRTGSTDKHGWRGAGLLQFSKDASGDFWKLALRSLAPWAAIEAEYERWRTAAAYTTGDYAANANNIYVAASTGTSGGTPPTHTSGTVSDGGVSWTYVDAGDRTLWSVDEYGRLKLNGGNGTDDLLSCRQTAIDTATTATARITARGTSRGAALILEPTDGSANVAATPYLRADSANGLRIMKSDSSTDLGLFTDSGGFYHREIRSRHATATDMDATPSVTGIGTLYLANSAATSITALDDGEDGQRVTLIAFNGNSTIVSSATLLLTGSANQALTAWSSITFEKVPTSISNRWIEVARSIK
ncbi:hypothetical protein [Chitinimonas koreensis]|nr:hypothetical protein [Chitinimonas koreensis]